MSKFKNIDIKKRIKIEITILTSLFLISIFLPYLTIYDIESTTIDYVEFGYENINSFYFGITYLIASLALFSYEQKVIFIVNPIIILAAIVISILTIWSMAVCGVSGSLNYGFLISFLLILILVFRSYQWSQSVSLIHVKKGHSNKLKLIILSIPLILYLIYSIKQRQPQFIASSRYENDGRTIKSYSYDWEGENVEFTKYYTIHKNKNILKGKNIEVLDSISMTFYSENNKVIKEVTKKAKNGKLDLNDFF